MTAPSTEPNPLFLHGLIKVAMTRLTDHRIEQRSRAGYDATLFEVHFALSDLQEYQKEGGQVPPFNLIGKHGGAQSAVVDNINGTRIQVHTEVKAGQAWIMYDGEIIEIVQHPAHSN